MGCGADIEANALMTSLTAGLDFSLPAVDLSGDEFQYPGGALGQVYQEVAKLSNADLTTEVLEGTGTFDALMRGFKAHLQEEYDKGRITGAEYAKVYTELTIGAMGNSVQFLLGREATFWQAVTGQMQAIAGRAQIEVEKARIVSARLEANTLQANYALTKLKLATEDKNYCIAEFNLEQLMPMQLTMTTEQAESARGQTMDTRLDGITPIAGVVGAEKELKAKQGILVEEQTEVQRAQTMDTRMDGTTLVAGIVGTQRQLTEEQIELIAEQKEAQRAQTLDTRSDGAVVVGSIGKQKDLHSQQIVSYQRDAETKAAKIFTDAWTVQKTIDEGLLAPTGFTNTSIDQVLTAIKTNNDLV